MSLYRPYWVDTNQGTHTQNDHVSGNENVMIRVNCVRFNMTAADAQDAQLGIGGL